MGREKPDDKQKRMLKRMRRIRGGRTLPQSGGGIHEDKKSKKVEQQLAEEANEEMQNWKEYLIEVELEAILEDNTDMNDEEFWDEWKYPDIPEDYELEKNLTKDREKKDVSTD